MRRILGALAGVAILPFVLLALLIYANAWVLGLYGALVLHFAFDVDMLPAMLASFVASLLIIAVIPRDIRKDFNEVVGGFILGIKVLGAVVLLAYAVADIGGS